MSGLKGLNPRLDRSLLREIIDDVDKLLSEKEEAREFAIKVGRDVVKASRRAIADLQFLNMESAHSRIKSVEEMVAGLMTRLSGHPDLVNTGLVTGPLSEYVEARILYSILVGEPIPSHRDLGVPYTSYLQGLGDVVGELRRLILELIRGRDYTRAWLLLDIMESIYLELSRLTYPEALLPGIRHKVDVARKLLDSTKALLLDIESRA